MYVTAIYTAPEEGAATVPCATVECGLTGLAGDRHQDGTVTLVELPVVAGIRDLDNGGARRQLVVAMDHPDQRLWPTVASSTVRIGGALLMPLQACEPCARLAHLIDRPVPPRELVHTGLRCRVVRAGRISVGNRLQWMATTNA